MKKHKSVFYKITALSLIFITAAAGLHVAKNYIFKEKAVFSASDFGDSIDIFRNYESWKKSLSKKTGDTMSQTLYVLGRSILYGSDPNTSSPGTRARNDKIMSFYTDPI